METEERQVLPKSVPKPYLRDPFPFTSGIESTEVLQVRLLALPKRLSRIMVDAGGDSNMANHHA